MKELKYTKAHNPGQLLEELEAGIPALRPVTQGGERQAVMTLSSGGDQIALLVPDETSEPAVAAVIASHIPRPPVPQPDLAVLWQTYKANVQAATTIPQLKAAMVNDLGPLLRAIARGSRGDINGG